MFIIRKEREKEGEKINSNENEWWSGCDDSSGHFIDSRSNILFIVIIIFVIVVALLLYCQSLFDFRFFLINFSEYPVYSRKTKKKQILKTFDKKIIYVFYIIVYSGCPQCSHTLIWLYKIDKIKIETMIK